MLSPQGGWMHALRLVFFFLKMLPSCWSPLSRAFGQPSSACGSGPAAAEESRKLKSWWSSLRSLRKEKWIVLIILWVMTIHCWMRMYWLVHPLTQQLAGFSPKAKKMWCGCWGQSYWRVFTDCLPRVREVAWGYFPFHRQIRSTLEAWQMWDHSWSIGRVIFCWDIILQTSYVCALNQSGHGIFPWNWDFHQGKMQLTYQWAPPLECRLANGSRVSVARGRTWTSLGFSAIKKHWKIQSSHRFYGFMIHNGKTMPVVLVTLISCILRGWAISFVLLHFLNPNKTAKCPQVFNPNTNEDKNFHFLVVIHSLSHNFHLLEHVNVILCFSKVSLAKTS